MNKRERHSIRLKGYDYSRVGSYFITICTQNRLHLFGRVVNGEMILNDAGKMIFDQWMGLSQRFHAIELHECVVMPNHIHGIIKITHTTTAVGVGLVPTLNGTTNDGTVNDRVADDRTVNDRAADDRAVNDRVADDRAVNDRATTRVAPTGVTIGDMVGAYKSLTTHAYIDGVKQLGWQRFNKKIWQRNYWEHIIRDESEYDRIAQYIVANPLKWDMDQLNDDGSEHQVMEPDVAYNHEVWMI